jgi:hypothetical protein
VPATSIHTHAHFCLRVRCAAHVRVPPPGEAPGSGGAPPLSNEHHMNSIAFSEWLAHAGSSQQYHQYRQDRFFFCVRQPGWREPACGGQHGGGCEVKTSAEGVSLGSATPQTILRATQPGH